MTRAASFVIACLLVVTGCPSVQRRVAIRNCQFSVRNLEITRITPFKADFLLTVGVYNPNDIEVEVDRFQYAVLVNGHKVAEGWSKQELTIPVNQSRNLTVSLNANTLDVGVVIQRIKSGGRRVVQLRGTSFIRVPWGIHKYPFQVERRF